MYLLIFSIFIFLFTVFENVFLALGFLFISIIVVILVNKKILKQIAILFTIFLMAFLAVSIRQKNYKNKTITTTENNFIWADKSQPQGNNYIGTGLIQDKYSAGRYVFLDQEKNQYFLHSEKDYDLGKEVFLQAFFVPGRTGMNRIYNANDQKKLLSNLQKIKLEKSFLEYQFDYPKRLMMKNFAGNLYEKTSLPLTQHKISFISKMKVGLENKVLETYGESRSAGLILGMLVGDRSHIPTAEYQGFVSSGLVHIVAVSGGNIIMIVVFLSAILFFLPFYLRTATILLAVLVYAAICGMDSSVIRAALMGGMSMLALFRGREVQIWRALSTAFVLMLLFNPYFLVYDVGFILSFSAIIGLVRMQQRQSSKQQHLIQKNQNQKTKHKNRLPKKLRDYTFQNYLGPTLGASLGVFPVLIFFMGQMNLLGIVGNLLILPIIPFIMIYGFISLYLFQIFHRTFLLTVETKLIDYVFRVSEKLNQYGLFVSTEIRRVKYLILGGFLIAFLRWRLGSKKLLLSNERKRNEIGCS